LRDILAQIKDGKGKPK
jgi:hypothetical protein